MGYIPFSTSSFIQFIRLCFFFSLSPALAAFFAVFCSYDSFFFCLPSSLSRSFSSWIESRTETTGCIHWYVPYQTGCSLHGSIWQCFQIQYWGGVWKFSFFLGDQLCPVWYCPLENRLGKGWKVQYDILITQPSDMQTSSWGDNFCGNARGQHDLWCAWNILGNRNTFDHSLFVDLPFVDYLKMCHAISTKIVSLTRESNKIFYRSMLGCIMRRVILLFRIEHNCVVLICSIVAFPNLINLINRNIL